MNRLVLVPRHRPRSTAIAVACMVLLMAGVGIAQGAGPGGGGGGGGAGGGNGGTSKPPPFAVAPTIEPTLSNPAFTDLMHTHGFAELGFVQDATVSTADCPGTPAANAGGTVTINDIVITVPCNLTIQMPANTFTWADFVHGGPNLTLKGTPAPFPAFEVQVIGNIVTGRHIAGLMYFSQQALNAGSGFISGIDYADGSFTVDPGTGNPPVTVQLNDPKITVKNDPAYGTGRYSAGQSPDPRLSVDQANPTVRAATGYPMCIPRTDPASADDPRCPQENRPPVAAGCRNFTQANVLPPFSGELTPPTGDQKYCTEYVMPDPAVRGATDPDAREQAPFEVGDHVTFAGSLFKAADGSQYISAHTVTADLGIYTQPGSKPSYVAIDGSTISTGGVSLVGPNGAAQESVDRLVVEADTTDVKSPVDVYLPDINPGTGPNPGQVRNRWVTPYAMTGEFNSPYPLGGGITTQNRGPQPQRIRLRATRAPAGLLDNPTRLVRIANRVTCAPSSPSGNNFDGSNASTDTLTDVDTCLANVPLNANGLRAGMYTAPMFTFIFPENTKPGDPLVPYDLWHLGFLRFGEGDNPLTPSTGPLTPTPW